MFEQVIGEVELEVRKEPCAKGRCRCVNDRVFLPFVTEFEAMKGPAPKLFGGLDRPGCRDRGRSESGAMPSDARSVFNAWSALNSRLDSMDSVDGINEASATATP